jgi:hypothetical protein
MKTNLLFLIIGLCFLVEENAVAIDRTPVNLGDPTVDAARIFSPIVRAPVGVGFTAYIQDQLFQAQTVPTTVWAGYLMVKAVEVESGEEQTILMVAPVNQTGLDLRPGEFFLARKVRRKTKEDEFESPWIFLRPIRPTG